MKQKISISTAFVVALIFIKSAFADQINTFMLPSGVQIKIIEKQFSKSIFKITNCGSYSAACIINGQIAFGAADEIPKTYISMINAFYKGYSYSLDSSNMYNAWGNRKFELNGKIRYFGGWCYDGKNCQFRGLFSDAAGTFVTEWKVIDGVSVRTVLTDSDDVIQLFMKNIDPPEHE
jgi:hypothetical protein